MFFRYFKSDFVATLERGEAEIVIVFTTKVLLYDFASI